MTDRGAKATVLNKIRMVETIPELPKSLDGYGSVVPADMSDSDLDVATCLEQVRQRDEDAARRLLNHLHPLVLKLVRAHLPRRSSVEDLTQIVFMKVFANLDQFSGAVPLEHWVSRIAVNVCFSQLKAEQSRPELRWADLDENQSRVLETLASTTEDLHPGQALAAREIVEQLLGSLAPADRLLLTLLYLEGRSIEEVHRLTGWNRALIRVRAFRARHKLKKTFGKLVREEKP
jgi:RNA polymerase sigma-70 factor, ECF subfamily